MPSSGYRKYNLPYELLQSLHWGEDLSSGEIGRKLGVPQNTVNRYLREFGLSDPLRRPKQSGELGNNWQGGTSRSYINRLTKKLCEDNNIPLNLCQVCNSVWSQNLDRHHIDEDRSNNVIENIVVLCPAC